MTGEPLIRANQTVAGLPDWEKWHIHRIDWAPVGSAWYIDGVLAATSKVNVPRHASRVVLNMWSNGGNWTGVMPVGEQAELQIQWIEVVFNATGRGSSGARGVVRRDSQEKSCKTVCAVDGVDRVGSPERRTSSTKTSSTMMLRPDGILGFILVVVCISLDLIA